MKIYFLNKPNLDMFMILVAHSNIRPLDCRIDTSLNFIRTKVSAIMWKRIDNPKNKEYKINNLISNYVNNT